MRSPSFSLAQILEKKGQTAYGLAAVSGVPYYTIWKLVRNETQNSINLSVLSRIISALDCEITDILEYDQDEDDKLVRLTAKARAKKKAGK